MLNSSRRKLTLLLVTSVIFFGSIFAPPHLMDDVDSSFAQSGRNMLVSGDWVTPHLNGVRDMEKPPLLFWLMALSYKLFGVHDWSARLPLALGAIALCFLTFYIGTWVFEERVGYLAALILATSVGLYLFTRVFFLDCWLAVAVSSAMFCLFRAMEPDEPRPSRWAMGLGASLGLGLLAKGLIAIVLPGGAGLFYLVATRQFKWTLIWNRLSPPRSVAMMLVIAAPWHILAGLRNPPIFEFNLHSGPGQYHGFVWFYFINEHLLRFLNLRYPRDYATVPRIPFWLLNLVWMFPWSAYLLTVARLRFSSADRAGRMRLLCLCWAGFLLLFFTFSTTQEYYVLSCLPAFALLLGSGLGTNSVWIARGTRFLTVVFAVSFIVICSLFFAVRHMPAPGDISAALVQHPEDYTLSTGHFHDLTLAAFAYLRIPLLIAGLAFLLGTTGTLRRGAHNVLVLVVTMILFQFAAQRALAVFDPYLSSQPLAVALTRSVEGQLIIDGQYYHYSSIFFYAQRPALLLNGRVNDLEYGSNAPDCPPVYIVDAQFVKLWGSAERMYLVTDGSSLSRLNPRLPQEAFHLVATIGGKSLYTNQSLEQR